MNAILISAIVCTYNRADLLEQALVSLVEQTLSHELYEVIVVDNASTDNTPQSVNPWLAKYTNFRYVFEPRLGLSHARNRGAAEARAPLIAYMDDDCTAGPEWLEALQAAFATTPKPACVGGRIHLRWESGQRPDWVSDKLLSVFGYLDLGGDSKELNHANGGNMAWDRDLLMQFGGFQSELGRKGNLRLGSEESALQTQARCRGAHILYAPGAVVLHFMSLERQSRWFVVHTGFMVGVSTAIEGHPNFKVHSVAELRQLGLRIKKYLSEHWLLAQGLVRRPFQWPAGDTLYRLNRCAILWGYVWQSLRG